MFKELVQGSLKDRGHIVPVSDISPEPSTSERYASLFSFDDGINGYVKVKQSIAGYAGILYAEELIIDVDCEDLETARNSAVQVVSYLNAEFSIAPDDLTYYFSGAKGFHIYIPSKLFGGFQGDKQLAAYFKDFASDIAEKVDNLDLKIYEPVRIFRIPNSTNAKTGLYKIEISFEELQNSTIDEIKTSALSPRSDFHRPKPLYAVTRNNLLSIHWNNITSKPSSSEVDRYQMISDDDFFSPAMEGDRNNKLFRQASMLFDLTEGKIHRKAVLQLLRSVNYASGNPISEEELRAVVKSAETKIERNGKLKPKQEVEFKSVTEWLPSWESVVLDPGSDLTIGLPSFDAILKGKLRGKLCGISGYGGSKKSLLGLQILNHNISDRNAVAMYSSMEMSAIQAIDREIDQLVELGDRNASEIIKDFYKSDIENARTAMYRDIGKKLGNSLFISQNSRMNAEDYRKAIIDCSAKAGKVDILLVDGLSMMDDSGTETEAANKNSADLKEIANEFGIFVIVIIHCSKGAQKHTRDLEQFLRGSQKLADNVDFLIYLSLVEDLDSSDEYSTEYLSDKGYARLYDKRGTGEAKNIIMNFKANRLLLEESIGENPKYYERKK